jgi:hypothetical protein
MTLRSNLQQPQLFELFENLSFGCSLKMVVYKCPVSFEIKQWAVSNRDLRFIFHFHDCNMAVIWLTEAIFWRGDSNH